MSEDFPEATHVEVQNEEVDAEHKAERMDESAEAFHSRMGQLMAEGRDIFVFRGAGTKNGIALEDVPGAVDKIMANLQTSLDAGRKVAIMFDGDEDNREKPDVGAVFGLVADLVKDNENVVAIAAQQESWYYPEEDGGDLKSATGTPYETFVFPDSTPGGHASLTQSKDLAQYENYKQFFVGPAGAIAGDQLRDLNEKAQGRPEDKKVEVIAIATHNNGNLTQEFEDKAKTADEAGDTAKADGFRATLKQREEQPYGMMYGADSYKSFLPSEYPNVDIKFDESLVGEFQEMRAEPLKDTYQTDVNLAATMADSGRNIYMNIKHEQGGGSHGYFRGEQDGLYNAEAVMSASRAAIERLKKNLQKNFEFIEKNPEQAELLYLQAKSIVLDKITATVFENEKRLDERFPWKPWDEYTQEEKDDMASNRNSSYRVTVDAAKRAKEDVSWQFNRMLEEAMEPEANNGEDSSMDGSTA